MPNQGARSADLGKPLPDAPRAYDALHRAFDSGQPLMQPGRPLSNIYKATAQSMWLQGFDSQACSRSGLGGFIIEEQLLITRSGREVMAPLPQALRRLWMAP